MIIMFPSKKASDRDGIMRLDQQSSRDRDTVEYFSEAGSLDDCKADNVGFQTRRTSMKTITSALIALSLLTAIAAPASALDSKEFWQQQERSRY